MCIIITLAAGASINKKQLFNGVYNNWHGYGLVLKDSNGKLQVLRGFNEEGTDPEVVWKLLEDNKDIERYLHVRHSTKGAEDETNVQPFPVFSSNSRDVYFMHNGTLYTFGSSNSTGKSDTLEFCEKILTPSLLRWDGPQGKGDYTDEDFYRLIMEKHWNQSSMGLLLSNDLPYVRIGSGWSLYKHPDETSSGEVYVSNTTYFDRVQRGPRFQYLEEVRRERGAAEKAKQDREKASQKNENSGVVGQDEDSRFLSGYGDDEEWPGYGYPHHGASNNNNISKFLDAGIKEWSPSAVAKSPKVLKAIADITNQWNFEDPDDVRKLNAVTYDEWVDFLDDESPYMVAALIEELCGQVAKSNLMVRFLKKKQERAEKKIIALKEFEVVSKKEEKNDVETQAA